MHCICHTCIQTVVDVCYNCNNESITDAIAITANDDNGEKVDGKDGNGINGQWQISDAENGRETFNNNEFESNYEENDMKEMGDKNNKSDDDEEKNDDTDEKKNHTKIELVRIH